MAPCPRCGTEMSYVSQYGQWYCNTCQSYQQAAQQPFYYQGPPGTYPVQDPGEEERKKKKIIIAVVIVVVVLVIVLPLALAGIMYLWVSDLAETSESYEAFPTIQVTLTDNEAGDQLKIKHIQGDPIIWSKYKIVITDTSGSGGSANLNDLSSLATLSAGGTTTIGSSIAGFDDIDYQTGKAYEMDIYDKSENKRVYSRDNLICT